MKRPASAMTASKRPAAAVKRATVASSSKEIVGGKGAKQLETAKAADTEIHLTIQAIGRELSMTMPASSTVSALKLAVCKEMGLSSANTVTLAMGTDLLQPAGSLLRDFRVCGRSSVTVTAVVVPAEIRVRKHVYRSGGGAPPWRRGTLVSTEEVVLRSDESLMEQYEELTSCGGFRFREVCLVNLQGEAAPELWVDLKDKESLDVDDETRLASGVFEGTTELAVLAPMRGMD